ncbi:hypothetical protein XR48_10715 [Salmonella enterica]|nr:hypothetical protein [Salmonella enterica]EBG4767599.1 hypothetical protein [Salmonella enterica subsp. enterica serovar Schwarzengrund]EBL3993268.1 hypothetical protein [Salmonella enterica subsp. enterica serovar Schwarzengrund]EBM8328782.1 hypothetical protein [Salmonella enterica subsp. enterica serovar Schwarzengrund]EBM9315659.1 hypothetical protein [Salmonella enterica subsp. enterica serovar Schwarzengrund]
MKDLWQTALNTQEQNSFAATCKPEDNLLLNGVFLWVETTGAGHAFVSVHMDNSVYLYTYGRYGRTGSSATVGDGILNFFEDEDARSYYRYELYQMEAHVFEINDANPILVREFFEKLWNAAKPPVPTKSMTDRVKLLGRTIDIYDVTGNNCTTHSVEGIKYSGSKIFETKYILPSIQSSFGVSASPQLTVDTEIDFTIPFSLQQYLIEKSSDFSSMSVMNMTSEFRQQYPNIGDKSGAAQGLSAVLMGVGAKSSASSGTSSPYSGGTSGGSLGSSYNDK